MQVKSSTFECRATSCIIPSLLVVPYVFAAVTAGRAKRILLAGFDGYGAGDFHQNEMVNVINCYTSSTGSLPLVAITPSTYPVEQSSLYSPSV